MSVHGSFGANPSKSRAPFIIALILPPPLLFLYRPADSMTVQPIPCPRSPPPASQLPLLAPPGLAGCRVDGVFDGPLWLAEEVAMLEDWPWL
ncbi:hypothetical protein AAFF_G00342190 [Aldrovandia affinis]|uniref:Uncharacterized protein n=1 Tax=Aldrovandia affinis TaxID=143900 RepID=A0AAD7R6K0_9TELE|nr:hypothetical protein AAFF_G00342190 [Aldrovandia affinis]